MKEISNKEIDKLTDIIHRFQQEQNSKQLKRFLDRLTALNNKYDTNYLRNKITNLIDELLLESPNSEELAFLKTLLDVNFDVNFVAGKVVGFYAPPDKQLVPLPIPIGMNPYSKPQDRVLKVEFPAFEEEKTRYWQKMGFYEAISLPYQYKEIAGIGVLVVRELLPSQHEAAEHGFSPPVMVVVPRAFDVLRLIEQSIYKEKSIPQEMSEQTMSKIVNRSLSKLPRSYFRDK